MQLSWFYFSLHSPSMFLASLDDCNADVAVLHLSSGQRLSSDFIVTCVTQGQMECSISTAEDRRSGNAY